MEKYKMGEVLGDGSFGTVVKAINHLTGEVVAIKRMKRRYPTWEECEGQNEVKVLIKLHHPNIVRLFELIKQQNQVYFVFEFMSRNVLQVIQERRLLSHTEVRNIIYQTLQALAYMHRHGYFHRDLKPENLLEMHGTVKIADFGLVRSIRAQPPFTQYISTRWYRAPEVLLRSRVYNAPMDLFAIGAIMAELYTLIPLFPGSNQTDQMTKIFHILGTPSREEWPDGHRLAASMGFDLPSFSPQSLASIIPRATPAALSLIDGLLQVNPQKRLTAAEALRHPYFEISEANGIQRVLAADKETESEDEMSWVKNVRYKPSLC